MVRDAVNGVAIEIMEKEGVDVTYISHDITCFNSTGDRCAVVYDHGKPIVYIMIGMEFIDGKWEKTWYYDSGERNGAGCYDGVDVMCEVDSFVHDHD